MNEDYRQCRCRGIIELAAGSPPTSIVTTHDRKKLELQRTIAQVRLYLADLKRNGWLHPIAQATTRQSTHEPAASTVQTSVPPGASAGSDSRQGTSGR